MGKTSSVSTAVPSQAHTFGFEALLLGAYMFETVEFSSRLLDHYIGVSLYSCYIPWIEATLSKISIATLASF